MGFLWVLAAVLVWTEASFAAHLHRSDDKVTAFGARRRTLHTTEGHGMNDHQVKPEVPVALPLMSGHRTSEVSRVSAPVKARISSRRKREPSRPEPSSAAVLGELGKILKDDENEKKKRIAPDVKRQINLKANETIDEGNQIKQQKFEDWLRDEYIRNMALSIATVKRKRSSYDGRRKRSSRHDDAVGIAQEAKLKLQSLENSVLADALAEIVSRRDDSSSGEDEGQDGEGDLVARRLAQAYYLERLRGAVQRIEEEASQRDTWGEFQEEAEEEGEEQQQQPTEEDYYSYQKRDGGNTNLASVLPIMDSLDDRPQAEEEDLCPALSTLTSDCASLEELLTEGEMSLAIRHACNKHEVCYSCGEAFGLSSVACDRVFLDDIRSVCHSCSDRALGQLLIPLRDQRVFFKRSVPPICYRAPCVQRYLEEHY